MRNVKQKFLRQLVAVSTASLILVGSTWQEVQAQQRTISLFSTNCIGDFSTSTQEIVIGREVFTSIASMYSGRSPTCRIRPAGAAPSFSTLRLAFGLPDRSNGLGNSVTLNVYLDGTLAASRTISRGQRAFLAIDVSRASSIALEATSPDTTYMYFTQALLEPLSLSPGQRQ